MSIPYIIGLDLGQARDYSALVVLDQRGQEGTTTSWPMQQYGLTYLRRFVLGTSYLEVAREVASLAQGPRLGQAPLVVDQTGVGRPVLDILNQSLEPSRIMPVSITAGKAVGLNPEGGFRVPKKALIACLNQLISQQRLRIAGQLPGVEALTGELRRFQVKLSRKGKEQFGTWKKGCHDDLVLALALACWWGEQGSRKVGRLP